MKIHVLVVPETSDFVSDVLLENKIWTNKNLGRPQLEHWNAKYVAPYWLDPEDSRGANRIFQIVDVQDVGESYEITLGNSFYLPKKWDGLEGAQVRRFQYEPLSKFNLMEKADGSLVQMSREISNRFFPVELNESLQKEKNTFYNEFWTGQHTNVKKYWKAYQDGVKFIEQYEKSDVYILEISFKDKPKELPLFNIEPIVKTIKAYYNYIERNYATKEEFNSDIPLFLQEITRGSEVITLVGSAIIGVIPLLILIEKFKGQQLTNKLTKSKIDGQNLSNELSRKKIIGQEIKNLDDAYALLEKQYPKFYESYKKKEPPKEIRTALQNLINEGLGKIRISKKPIDKKDFDGAKNDMEEFDN